MGRGLNEENKDHKAYPVEGPRRGRRIGIQVPLYKKAPSKASTRLSPEEFHDAVERQRKYQENLKRQRIIPKQVVIGIVILLFDVAILQLLPYLVKLIGIHDPVLLGEWIIGLVVVITVVMLVYIFSSKH
jgi:hypothetical protein